MAIPHDAVISAAARLAAASLNQPLDDDRTNTVKAWVDAHFLPPPDRIAVSAIHPYPWEDSDLSLSGYGNELGMAMRRMYHDRREAPGEGRSWLTHDPEYLVKNGGITDAEAKQWLSRLEAIRLLRKDAFRRQRLERANWEISARAAWAATFAVEIARATMATLASVQRQAKERKR